MQAHTASLINAIVLIAISIWGYAVSSGASFTPLLPAAFAVGLLACYSGVKTQNKLVSHVAVALTLIVFVALFMPLSGAIGRGDTVAILRMGIMQASTAFALFYFVKSFIDARRSRA